VGGPLQGRKVVAVSCGAQHTLVRTSDGKVFGFGSNADGQLGTGIGGDERTPVEIVFPGGVRRVRRVVFWPPALSS
jgi:alpha-tubulin suppressor-like RCC1 family protein